MSLYDEKYLGIVEDVIKNGYYGENRTGMNTYKLPHKIMQFDLEKEFPILTTKKVAFKTAVEEMLWIFKDQSNEVKKLQEKGVKIWNEWEMEDGTIGTAYGYIVDKFDQIDKLIETLKTNPQDRRMMINLWQIPYIETGALPPCCFLSMWDVTDGRLNCMLVQRSGDLGLGVPFNTTQYAVLTHLLAQVTGLKVGLFTHVINNAHVYENHKLPLMTQVGRLSEAFEAPKLEINKDIKDFYDFTSEDIKLVDYKFHKKIKMDVSV
ncbi:MAG: thymidylate synthase [Lachnospirales bacterium]